jgi:plastocyanin
MRSTHRWILVGSLVVLGALAIYGCNGKKKNPVAPAPVADVMITITGQNGASSYSPSPANVTVGQTVAWINSGGMTHTASQTGGGFNTGNIANGATSSPITINTAGDLNYECSIHPSMTGILHVTP